jgi:hypothetical protein
MSPHMAYIERSNRRSLEQVEIRLTITESNGGRQHWKGEFDSKSSDGFLPDEQLAVTLDNGQLGSVRVSETEFSSRTPHTTLVRFTGSGLRV